MSDTSAEGSPRLAEEIDGTKPAHLVMRGDWPIALCGARVWMHLGIAAPGCDRCPTCLKIAHNRGLGRPGWLEPPGASTTRKDV